VNKSVTTALFALRESAEPFIYALAEAPGKLIVFKIFPTLFAAFGLPSL
jgi:hypothetical protein